MKPFLNKLETYHGAGKAKDHGSNGPVHVSDGGYRATSAESDFIAAAGEVGYPEIQDLQDLDSNNGFQRWLRYVSPDGKRQDAAHCYLHPRLQDGKHPNLRVLVQARVKRVIFDENKRAVGVEYEPNSIFQAEIHLTPHPTLTVKARKLVVLSCGSCGTPSVLERSGVGNPKILERASVPVVAELPGVGHDYQDHHLVFIPYRTGLGPRETGDAIISGRYSFDKALANKDPILGWNTVDVSSKLRPSDAEVAALGIDFQTAWNRDFKNSPNKPLMLMGYLGDQKSVPAGQYVSVACYTAYPYSRGHLHITGPNVDDPLDFESGFFSDPHDIDIKKQMWAYKKHREIMRRTKMYRGEVASGHPKFAPDSPAACVILDEAPSSKGPVRDIQYSAEDDRAIEQFLRENINTCYHSLGTAKMAPRSELGVVDERLNVHGVQGLKCVDLSIVPENVGANTNNTALVVGEKGAHIIAADLGLLPN
ncbi:hypothetical protein CLAIMM_12010 [Cladophialophora immunda]|nr:hypothetical protein CLAIMM_12010 [Cladophialophora immunda]